MPCVDFKRWGWITLPALAALAALAGCTSQPTNSAGPGSSSAPGAVSQADESHAAFSGKLPAPSAPHNWEEARLQAARRMVAANPGQTYTSKPPDMLLAIPVLSIELNADGSIRRIEVMRKPSQALDTIEIAKQAVKRAAPFGDVSRLPKPWKFNETFLFNNQRKFKPMTLDRR